MAPSPLAAAPAKAPTGGSKQEAAAVQPNPFTKASTRVTESFGELTKTLTASAQTLQQIDVPAQGYLADIVVSITVTGTTGATYNADAPWNVFEQITLADVNGTPIVQLTGYDLFLANMFGGYAQNGDPANYPGYTRTATGFTFQLRIPVQIVQRNALGALANMNAAMTYKIKATLAPIASVYATNGTGASATVKFTLEAWANPLAADLNGTPNTMTPPSLGTTQNWSEYVIPTSVGFNTLRFTRVGNVIRNIVFVNRDASGVRTDTGLPADLAIFLDGNQWKRNTLNYELQRIYELYGYNTERPAGVWVLCLTDDFDGTPGEEIGDYWLQTTGATRLELQGTFSAIGTLTLLTNDILSWQQTAGPGQTLGA
jgi:hypothetical protein